MLVRLVFGGILALEVTVKDNNLEQALRSLKKKMLTKNINPFESSVLDLVKQILAVVDLVKQNQYL